MMKRFLLKTAAFCLPIILLVIVYVITDVFKVIYHYDPFYVDSYYVELNRAYGSTVTYINQNPKYHYDSFIFGNSRSLFYEVDTWKKYLPKGSACMHFDEYCGAVSGISDKVAFIDKNGGKLNNVLMVIDHDLLYNLEQQKGYLFAEPPILKGYSNVIDFHIQHFTAFLNLKFLVSLADYKMFGKYRPYMKNIRESQLAYIPKYNEIRQTTSEEKIAKGIYYDAEHLKVFENKQKPGTYSSGGLSSQKIERLRNIKEIFDKHKTSYKIIISPLYDQIKLNRDVYNALCSIFGKEHVYDFSGVNKWNKDYHNYYEDSHYRPIVSAEILDIIYSK